MKKILLIAGAAASLAACVGFVEKNGKNGKTHDLYVLHPAITISGYISQL